MGLRYEIRLSGSGGQGIIVMGIVLAEAAGIFGGKYVVQTQSYGPEARGGLSRSELIISDEEIDYPKVTLPDLLLAMNQTSCDAYYSQLKNDGILILDSTLVTQIPTWKAYAIPFTQIARKRFKNELLANIIALGAISEMVPFITRKGIELSLRARLPMVRKETISMALRTGITEARRGKKKKLKMKHPLEIPKEDVLDSL